MNQPAQERIFFSDDWARNFNNQQQSSPLDTLLNQLDAVHICNIHLNIIPHTFSDFQTIQPQNACEHSAFTLSKNTDYSDLHQYVPLKTLKISPLCDQHTSFSYSDSGLLRRNSVYSVNDCRQFGRTLSPSSELRCVG
jgi:hypothetical protein